MVCLRRVLVWGCLILLFACERRPAISPWKPARSDRVRAEPVKPVTTNWPQLFGPEANSHAQDTGLRWDFDDRGPPVLWRRPVGSGYSAPVLRDGRLIIQQRIGDGDVIECCAADTGETLWTSTVPTAYECKYPYSHGPYATPTCGPETVCAVSADGLLRAVQWPDGRHLWQRDLLQEFDARVEAFGFGSSPRLSAGRLFLNVGGRRGCGIVAMDAATGTTLWTATDDGRGYTTAVIARQHGRECLYVLTDKGLESLDPATGQVRWLYPFGIQATPERVNAVTPLVIGDRVVLTSGPGPGTVVLEIRPDGSFRELWKHRRVLDSQYTNLLHVDGRLYGVTSRKSAVLRSLDLETGEQFWEDATDLCRGNSLFADGHILVLGEHGHLACYLPGGTQPQQLWMTDPLLDTPCYSAPALSRGRLYLRNERELLCLDLRPVPGDREVPPE